MFKIRPIGAVLKTWEWNAEGHYLDFRDHFNGNLLGRIQMVSVQNEKGEEVYQQPWWLERRSEIDIIATLEGKLVLVEIERHSVIPPGQYSSDWSEPPEAFGQEPGMVQCELPRGFSEGHRIEAEEETSYQVEYTASIGHVNANSSFIGTSPFVVVYKALPARSERMAHPSERIRRVKLFSPGEVANLETLCGFTKAALWQFCQWALSKQQDEFWRDIASEMVNGWTQGSTRETM